MNTPEEFWLYVHRVAETYDANGLTPDERANAITMALLAMTPTVQRQALSDLRVLAVNVADLLPITTAAICTAEKLHHRGGAAAG